MEDYKDVMLSEPPARFNNAGSNGPTIQAVSLENYKGILLCDRPTNLRSVNTGAGLVRAQADGGLPPFLPSGKSEDRHLGFQPTQENRARLELTRGLRKENPYGKSGTNPALSKHRRWLKSFAQEVKNMKLNEAEKQVDMQSKLQRIRDQQIEARRQQRENPAPSNDTAPATSNAQQDAPKPPKSSSVAAPLGKKSKAKPKWAMTEDEALDAELDECSALVQFAQNLNYDKFIEDYEVKEALAIMRERVRELAAEKKISMEAVARETAEEQYEDDDDADRISICPSAASTTTRERFEDGARQRREQRRLAREAAAKEAAATEAAAGAVAHDQGWNQSTRVADVLRNAIDNDTMALADKILATSTSMGKIHTRYSLARLLQNCVLGGKDASKEIAASQQLATMVYTGEAVAPPRQTKLSAEATGLQEGEAPQKRILTELRKAKDKTQNLPYMYRCPSL
jgi:hypothetical protein